MGEHRPVEATGTEAIGVEVDDGGVERVPFNVPTRVAGEAEALAEALRDGDLDGRLRELATRMAGVVGRATAFLTPSCTASLEMAAAMAGIGPGDEVIVPSFAFVTAASAFAQRGAAIRFADVDPTTGGIAPASVARLLSPRTRAVVVVHYGGRALRLDDLDDVLAGRDVVVVEDAAHSFPYAAPPSPHPAAPRRIVVASFHWTKNINCGEGGLLAVDDPELAATAQIVHDKGTDRARFQAREVARYQWIALGSSYSMSPMLAPPLAVQVDHLAEITARRRAAWGRYDHALRGRVEASGARVLDGRDGSAHTFAIILPHPELRPPVLAHLASAGVHATSHFEPLHESPVGRRLDPDRRCPASTRLAASLVRLPLFDSLDEGRQGLVVDAVTSAPLG